MTEHIKRNFKRNQQVPACIVAHNKLWKLAAAQLSQRNRSTVLAVYRREM